MRKTYEIMYQSKHEVLIVRERSYMMTYDNSYFWRISTFDDDDIQCIASFNEIIYL